MGFSRIKKHKFFSKVDWENLRQQEPPFHVHIDEDDAGLNFDDFGEDAAFRASRGASSQGEKRSQSEDALAALALGESINMPFNIRNIGILYTLYDEIIFKIG